MTHSCASQRFDFVCGVGVTVHYTGRCDPLVHTPESILVAGPYRTKYASLEMRNAMREYKDFVGEKKCFDLKITQSIPHLKQ
jgi:hypothetical protein